MSIKKQLDDIKEYLYAKGYDERSLDSTLHQGAFIKAVKEELALLDVAGNTTGQKMFFEVGSNGFFDQKDVVHLNFGFSFDPPTGMLLLESVEAKINACKRGQTYTADTLPHARELHMDLRSLEEAVLANSLSHHTILSTIKRKLS